MAEQKAAAPAAPAPAQEAQKPPNFVFVDNQPGKKDEELFRIDANGDIVLHAKKIASEPRVYNALAQYAGQQQERINALTLKVDGCTKSDADYKTLIEKVDSPHKIDPWVYGGIGVANFLLLIVLVRTMAWGRQSRRDPVMR